MIRAYRSYVFTRQRQLILFFTLLGNFFEIFYKVKNAPQGCALARVEYVAYATALGASVLRAIRFFIIF